MLQISQKSRFLLQPLELERQKDEGEEKGDEIGEEDATLIMEIPYSKFKKNTNYKEQKKGGFISYSIDPDFPHAVTNSVCQT